MVARHNNTNHKYHIEGMTDLAVIRKQSLHQSKDNRLGPAPDILVHHHARNVSCEGQSHELYKKGELV